MLQKFKNYYHLAQAFFSALCFHFPSKKLTVVGVTGTDGKTTTVSMIYHILKHNGYKVSMISSVEAKIGTKTLETGLHVTTPSPFQIQKLLKKAVDAGSRYFILEATSHGLHQNRLAFVDFKVAAITNVTHEHLDYHKNLVNYLNSKAKLFTNVNFSILNKDDSLYSELKKIASGKILTYGLHKNSDVNLSNFELKLKIPGICNRQNALAAAAVANALNIPKNKIQKALTTFLLPKGRMEEVKAGQKFKVYVDFAHTPNSLSLALQALRTDLKPEGKLIAVFGAAGNRDKTKRSKMGEAAAKNADYSILTSEDPRFEDPNKICAQIAQGFLENGQEEKTNYSIITDRAKAIEFAVKQASQNDIIGVFGKGHEKSMAFGKKELPWSDFEEIKKAIKRIN